MIITAHDAWNDGYRSYSLSGVTAEFNLTLLAIIMLYSNSTCIYLYTGDSSVSIPGYTNTILSVYSKECFGNVNIDLLKKEILLTYEKYFGAKILSSKDELNKYKLLL